MHHDGWHAFRNGEQTGGMTSPDLKCLQYSRGTDPRREHELAGLYGISPAQDLGPEQECIGRADMSVFFKLTC